MGEQNLHRFKAESGTGELMRGSFCEGVDFSRSCPENKMRQYFVSIWAAVTNLLVKSC